MKKIARICLLLVLCAGCHNQQSPNSTSTAEFSGRLDAALAMEERTARQNTLVKLAESAAHAGDSDVVLKAIAAIDAGTARNNTCTICSLALAKQGKTTDATAVAKEIADEAARNNTLAQIASAGEN